MCGYCLLQHLARCSQLFDMDQQCYFMPLLAPLPDTLMCHHQHTSTTCLSPWKEFMCVREMQVPEAPESLVPCQLCYPCRQKEMLVCGLCTLFSPGMGEWQRGKPQPGKPLWELLESKTLSWIICRDPPKLACGNIRSMAERGCGAPILMPCTWWAPSTSCLWFKTCTVLVNGLW